MVVTSRCCRVTSCHLVGIVTFQPTARFSCPPLVSCLFPPSSFTFSQFIKLTKTLQMCINKSLFLFPNMSNLAAFSLFLNTGCCWCEHRQQQSQRISFQIKCKALRWQLRSILCFFYCNSGGLSPVRLHLMEDVLSPTLAGIKTDLCYFLVSH